MQKGKLKRKSHLKALPHLKKVILVCENSAFKEVFALSVATHKRGKLGRPGRVKERERERCPVC